MITINEIFIKYASEYLAKYPNTSIRERKVIDSISQCRTAALGGYVEKCDSCGYIKTIYNSCRDRHCPQCQFIKKEQWILSRQNELLPFQYFHAVFTLPHELNPLVYHNRKLIFNLLFQTVKETLTSICEDKKYLGLKIGFFAILHTWGQKLNYHPHLHCVIPGGGLSVIKNEWKKCSKNYLLPIEVMKKRFRSLFLTRLKSVYTDLYRKGTIYESKYKFQKLIDKLFDKDWVCYLKESFKDHRSVIKYLGKYTHRIAMSNHRVLKLENRKVIFRYKDYKDGKSKTKSLDVLKFIRKFLLHVVPYRFIRIRYYGLLANRNKKASVKECRDYFNFIVEEIDEADWKDIYLQLTGEDLGICPECKEGKMHFYDSFGRPPPG